MTKIKKSKNLKVALFVDYGDNAKIGVKKEEKLKEYCKNHNYEIVHIYRTEKTNSDKFMNVSYIMNDIHSESIIYSTIIGYTISDFIADDMAELAVAFKVFQEIAGLKIITLREGIIGEDCLLNFTPSLNIKGKKELNNLNNQYLDEEIEKNIPQFK